MRDHGGNLDAAMARFGGDRTDWVDLSTGINPRGYPLPPIAQSAWATLPAQSEIRALQETARQAYGTSASILALAGAQAAIQMIPQLFPAGRARVLQPTYNEHAACLLNAGWTVEGVPELTGLEGADLAVLVNPNNPDGRIHARGDLVALSRTVGTLVVDESFADPYPDLSIAPLLGAKTANIIVLRSFGKFYGLAGLRLGFVLAADETILALQKMSGPWPVSGPAISVGRTAFGDAVWKSDTITRLSVDAQRLDALAADRGWRYCGGTPLFRLYETPDAAAAQNDLARARVWSRIFPYSDNWIRLGLPDGEKQWAQIGAALCP